MMDTPCHPRGRERATILSSLEGERGGPPLAHLEGWEGASLEIKETTEEYYGELSAPQEERTGDHTLERLDRGWPPSPLPL